MQTLCQPECRTMRRIALGSALVACSLAAAPARAALDQHWPEIASDRDGECRLEVTGTGRIFRLAAYGLGDGASGRYIVTNGAMTPLDWSIRANPSGSFARYYMPFRFGSRGDVVTVAVQSDRCDLSVSFPWTRYTGQEP